MRLVLGHAEGVTRRLGKAIRNGVTNRFATLACRFKMENHDLMGSARSRGWRRNSSSWYHSRGPPRASMAANSWSVGLATSPLALLTLTCASSANAIQTARRLAV